MYVNYSDNYPNQQAEARVLNVPPSFFSFFDFEIAFRAPSPVDLLNWVMVLTCDLYSITNRTVGNKYLNILCLFCVLI